MGPESRMNPHPRTLSQRHEDHTICETAVKILENYFGVNVEEKKPMQD